MTLQPHPRSLTAALEVASSAGNAAEAWRALAEAGHVPLNWLDDPLRVFRQYVVADVERRDEVLFVHTTLGDVLCERSQAPAGLDGVFSTTVPDRFRMNWPIDARHPLTTASCISVATDQRFMQLAEASVRRRCGARRQRIVWVLVPNDQISSIRNLIESRKKRGRGDAVLNDDIESLGYGLLVGRPGSVAVTLAAPVSESAG